MVEGTGDPHAEWTAATDAHDAAIELARQAYFGAEAEADATHTGALESAQLTSDTTNEDAPLTWEEKRGQNYLDSAGSGNASRFKL